MSKLRNFYNKISKNNRIISREDIGEMSPKEFEEMENAISYQIGEIGAPPNVALAEETDDVVFVHAYIKEDGTKVKAHYRSKAGQGSLEPQTNMTGGAASIQAQKSYIQNPKIKYSEIRNSELHKMVPADFTIFEIFTPPAIANLFLNIKRPDARELMDIALSDFKNLPIHNEFNVLQPKEVDYANKILNIGKNDKLAIPDNWHGVIYNDGSGFSRRLSQSPELQNQILAKYDSKKKEFLTNRILIDFRQDKNLSYSIGHGTVLNPQIKNGEFRGILFDKYDFDLLYNKNLDIKTKILNNSAYMLQTIKRLKNYYIIIPVHFKIGK